MTAHRRWLVAAFHWKWRVLAIASLHAATLMTLPLTLIGLGRAFAAIPVVIGFTLEAVRSVVRQRLRGELRSRFVREAALDALDRRTLVPEAEVNSTFWAAQMAEYAITVDLPAVLAAAVAGPCILLLSWATLGGRVLTWVLALALVGLAMSVWSSQRRASGLDSVVESRQRTAGWLAAAERDCGEIYGDRARGPYLAELTGSVRDWSFAEGKLEHKHLQHRILLGTLALAGVFALLRIEHIDPMHMELSSNGSAEGLSGFLLLGTGFPAAYLFLVHADSLLTCHAALRRIHPAHVTRSVRPVRALERRPSRLVARGLSFSYSGSPSSQALSDVTFDIDLPHILAIAAPNGMGKTTLARLICGVLSPDCGIIEVDGIACDQISRDDFGFVPQNPLIVDSLTIEDNIRLVAPDASAEDMDHSLLELGLGKGRLRMAGDLSRGEQRRIAIARAILKRPRLLLLDEPDVWLDAEGRSSLARLLEGALATCAVIVFSHRLDWLPNDTLTVDPFIRSHGVAGSTGG